MTKEILDNQGNKIGEIKEKKESGSVSAGLASGLGSAALAILAGIVIFGPGGIISKIRRGKLSAKEWKEGEKKRRVKLILLSIAVCIIYLLTDFKTID